MRLLSTSLLLAASIVALTAAQGKARSLPIDYTASVNAVGALGAVATTLTLHIDAFTSDRDRTALLDALKRNGYQAFLPAFRKVKVVGYVEINDKKWDLRWAQLQTGERRDVITAATDQPIYFVGGGNVDAKPRGGYEMAVIRLEVDPTGIGKGTLAPAARVRPTEDATSVEVVDYGGAPLPMTSVMRTYR